MDDLWWEVYQLWMKCDNWLVMKFMDVTSREMLEEKKEVLQKLHKGIPSAQISNFYQVLEKYPHDQDIWD